MALTLGTELGAAQEEQTRRPLVEISSGATVSDTPFAGTVLTSSTVDAFPSSLLTHSTGRLINSYIYTPDGGNSTLAIYFSNVDRSQFYRTTYDVSGSVIISQGTSMCELTDGNVGIVWGAYTPTGGGYGVYNNKIRRTVVTPQGVPTGGDGVLSEGSVWAQASGYELMSRPTVATVGANSYMVICIRAVTDSDNIVTGDYKFYKQTSTDFVSWSAASEISIADLEGPNAKYAPYLLKAANGNLYLFFSYVEIVGDGGGEIKNIYYSMSSNNGSTWGAATRVTNYTSFSQGATDPAVVESVAGQFTLLFDEVSTALQYKMGDQNTAQDSHIGRTQVISYDGTNGKIYVYGIGTNHQSDWGSVCKVDINSWTEDDRWDLTTSPAFPSYIYYFTCNYKRDHPDENLIPISYTGVGMGNITLLDGQAGSIRTYSFLSNVTYGVTQNVTWTDPASSKIRGTWVDKANNRLYVLLAASYFYDRHVTIGYLDLTELTEPYTFHQILTEHNLVGEGQTIQNSEQNLFIDPAGDWIVWVSNGANIWEGAIRVWSLSTGLLHSEYSYPTNTLCPYFGMNHVVVVNDVIYGDFTYQADYGQSGRRGLCSIDIFSGAINYYEPPWSSSSTNYGVRNIAIGKGGTTLLLARYVQNDVPNSGISTFDTVTRSWVANYNELSMPGLSPFVYIPYGGGTHQSDWWSCVAWDSANEMIIAGFDAWATWWGLVYFSDRGVIHQIHSITSTNSGVAWGATSQITQGTMEKFPAVSANPNSSTSSYVFWSRLGSVSQGVEENNAVVWAQNGSGLDLSQYLVSDTDVVLSRSVDGSPAKLTFTLAEGHLFDPYNTASLLSVMVKKGRRITLRFGEMVLGSSYWQNMGSFIVTDVRMSYEFGKYGTVSVIAEDERVLWSRKQIYSTAYYEGDYPELILEDVLEDETNLIAERINIANFANRVLLIHQWMDTTLGEIIRQICDRFGYFYRFDVDGVFTCRKISVTNAIDHDYAVTSIRAGAIITYEPDDSFSDFTNKVVVTGQDRNLIDIFYPEERIKTLRGTFGWYGFDGNFEVSYSEDRTRTCRDPRLVVLESVESFGFQLAGGCSQSISAVDLIEYKSCVVTVTAPNLTGELLAAIAIVIAGYFLPDMLVAAGCGAVSGYTVRVGTYISNVGIVLALMVLGSVGNYQLEVWAVPTGKVRRSLQSLETSGQDYIAQQETGIVIERKLDDPLCYSIAECNEVADHELMVVKYQRRRLRVSKIAHLKDEEGDTIKIVHPYTNSEITMFITNLTRKFKQGDSEGGGYFIDELEGWVVDMGAVTGWSPPVPPAKQDRSGGGGGAGSGVLGAYASSSGLDLQDGRQTSPQNANSGWWNGWWASGPAPQWWEFCFGTGNGIIIEEFDMYSGYGGIDGTPTSFTISGSMTGAFSGEETLLKTVSGIEWYDGMWRTFQFANSTAFVYYRINITATVNNGTPWLYYVEAYQCDHYSVGTTGELIPSSGSFTADSEYSGSYPASAMEDQDYGITRWLSADTPLPHWVQYDFGAGNECAIVDIYFRVVSDSAPVLINQMPLHVHVFGSNTGVFGGEETQLYDGNLSSGLYSRFIGFENSSSYRYYRIVIISTSNGGSNLVNIGDIQFFATAWDYVGDDLIYFDDTDEI